MDDDMPPRPQVPYFTIALYAVAIGLALLMGIEWLHGEMHR